MKIELAKPYFDDKEAEAASEVIKSRWIVQGKKTKEIAEILSLSIRTIEFHRTKIRGKIGLQSQKDSLQAHLLTLDSH